MVLTETAVVMSFTHDTSMYINRLNVMEPWVMQL